MPSANYYTTGYLHLIVQGVGHPKLSRAENAKDTYISFSGNGSIILEWNNFHWKNFSVGCRDRDPYFATGPNPTALFEFLHIHTISFSDCTISQISGAFFFQEVGSVTFDSCNIIHNDLTWSDSCTSLGSSSSIQNGLIAFTAKNTTRHEYAIVQSLFSHNLGPVSGGALVSYYQPTYEENHLEVSLTVSGCHFLNNHNLTLVNISDEVQNLIRGSMSAAVFDCVFIANRCTFTGCINFVIKRSTENFTAGLTIYNNTFQENLVVSAIDYSSLIHASILSECIRSVNYTASISDIDFTGNVGALVSVYDMFSSASKLSFSNIEIHNNSANDYLIQVMCVFCKVDFDEADVSNNSVRFFHSLTKRVAIVDIQAMELALARSIFANNTGTAIAFENSRPESREYAQFKMTKDIRITGNRGLYGGGVLLVNARISSDSSYSNVLFEDNVATYGDAIYFRVTFSNRNDDCLVDNITKLSGHFVTNIADTSAQSLFIDASQCQCFQSQDSKILPEIVSSTPTNIALTGQDSNDLSVFPGKEIVLNLTVEGCFNSKSSCLADVALICNNPGFCEYDGVIIHLQGPPTIVLQTRKASLGLSITTSSLIPNFNISLLVHFNCQGNKLGNLSLPLRLVKCPYGLVFSNQSSKCECMQFQHFLCSPQTGVVCVRSGYWFGMVFDHTTMQDVPVLHQCDLPFCLSSNLDQACPLSLSGETSGYIVLEQTQDAQCLDSRGGALCRSCAAKHNFTFAATQCIEEDACKVWHPYMVLILSIGFQLLLAFILIAALQLELHSGSGYLYGPLFFVSVISHVPQVNNIFLKTIVSIFSSVLLVNLEIFGYIPWCFFGLSPLLHFSFRFLGPAMVSLVLVLLLIMAQACPQWFSNLARSPVQAISFLILLSFWSLADTSMQIIQYMDFSDSGSSLTHVSLEPDLAYLTGIHIPFWTLAVLILVFLVFPFILFLFLTPFLAIKYNLNIVKPFMDEFQSCYHDNYRWYSAVYFTAWIVFRLLVITNQDDLVLTGLVLLMGAQIMIFPYSSRWLNVTDSLLLGDLAVLVSIDREDQSTSGQVLLSILILSPLAYITLGSIYLVLEQTKCTACIKKFMSRSWSKHANSPEPALAGVLVTRTTISFSDASCEEREPLLQFMADQNQGKD